MIPDEQKQQYIEEYFERERIRLDPDKIEYNPGLQALAKLMLNLFWGRYFKPNDRTNANKVETKIGGITLNCTAKGKL